ncbi:GTP cyclohydrolase II /3,4-dihydroxy-2-butanone 4-phosphate synthase [Labedella gwakjiensis]|uniref:GTP cyclohydrolase-2 n=1 Tax=Labedella gwakjiensis TaxID=390269 RepID=A0A2P8GXM0_9MICO|nr:GTP cyclohydrolase II [Labedella gwakjiensis]PSL38722.1 GTP cyclohydrolase II /3,4-dihydroxy-2-butanone 4-phosphate synthase [Labedella gwakjiensis]RUQ86788.1 GTP cyclohydrolase II [Labedella gwakjiensis]
MTIATIPEALDALRAGKPVIVADDEGRENEGDAIMAAQFATREWMAWIIRHSSGYVCAPMTGATADRLELPPMVARSEDPRGTAYTISVDAASHVTTGISAHDRAHTLRTLADPASGPSDVIRPGHILPLRAVAGGVRARAGHTEAAVDLLTLAGLEPVGVIAELVEDDGDMMRLPGLITLGQQADLPVITIADLIDFLDAHPEAAGICDRTPGEATHESAVRFEVETTIPTTHGSFRVRAYRDRETGADHVAIISGEPTDGAIVRVHSECLTGEAFGSLKCECGPQLTAALDEIDRSGGIVIYLRGHEGRGIGLVNKLRAYRLQEDGLDTLDANLALGLPADARSYTAATAILEELGISTVRLLTNNPEKVRQLESRGIAVSERVPLVVGVGEINAAYLDTKRDRMGHQLDRVIPVSEPAIHGERR